MTEQKKTTGPALATAEETIAQVQKVTDSVQATVKQAALASVEAYAKSVDSALETQQKFVGTAGIAAIDDLVSAQTKLFSDLNSAYVSAARAVLV